MEPALAFNPFVITWFSSLLSVRWRLQLAVLLGLCLALVAIVLGFPILFHGMSRVVPENYGYLAREALQRGQYDRAESILERRINREWYDFAAHYILAEAQQRAGRPKDAAETMREVLRKAVAIRGRIKGNQAGYSGFDEAKTVQLLARYLWESGEYLSATEVWRHAMDLGSSVAFEDVKSLPIPSSESSPGQALGRGLLALRTGEGSVFGLAYSHLANAGPAGIDLGAYLRSRWMAERENNTTTAETVLVSALDGPQPFLPALALLQLLERQPPTQTQPGTTETASRRTHDAQVRPVSLSTFLLPQGASIDQDTIRITRRGILSATVDSGMFRSTRIIIAAEATEAFGQWPVLVVRVNGSEASRLYLDGTQPLLRVIGPWSNGLPKVVDLELEFTNDAYDPITRSDRDIRIRGIWFQ